MIPIESYKYYNEGFANDAVLLGENAYNIYEWAFDTYNYEDDFYEEKLEYKDFKNNQEVLDSFNSCNYIVRKKLNL